MTDETNLDQDLPLDGGGEGDTADQEPVTPVDRGPWFYAQLGDGGVCVAVTQTAGPIDAAHMLRVDGLDETLTGRTYTAGEWSAPPTPSPTKPFIDAVDAHLDAGARAHGYDGIVSACSYAAAPNHFQAESVAFLQWRSACWVHCHAVLAQVQAQARPVPTPAELVAELPAYAPPEEAQP